MKSSIFLVLSLAYGLVVSSLQSPPASAQVTTDGTTSTTVNVNGNNFEINQGDRIGDNLFHSFEQFSVPTLGSAAFNNASDIANIFSRVTGNSISDIDGLISANGAANLFLINPNGIIFGENASLNLGGSFFASTADSLLFEDNLEFSASNPQAPPLLKVNMPIGLNLGNNPGDIVNQSVAEDIGLQVSLGENITLVGGNINLEGGRITAPGGIVELGGLLAAGEIDINPDGSLSFPNGIARADVSLTNQAEVDVRAGGGGFINVNARNLEILGGSDLLGGIQLGLGTPEAKAGDIVINATEDIRIGREPIDFSLISNNVGERGVSSGTSLESRGSAGNIFINTSSLEGSNLIISSDDNFGEGNAGTIAINATGTVSLEGISDGIGGGSSQLLGFLSIAIQTSPFNETSSPTTVIPSAIFSQIGEISQVTGGNIEITSNTLSLSNGGRISVRNFGQGNGGNIELQAGSLTLERGVITAETASNQGGNINLQLLDLLTLRNSSQISATAGTAQAGGNGGNITIDAPFIIAFPNEDSNIQADAFEGKGGNITIDTNGIFGIEERDKETNLSDITASSEFGQQGAVEINTSAVDPTRGLNNLPQEEQDTEVAQSCQETGSQSTLEFFDVGRGGLPPTPEDLFSSEIVIAEWIPLDVADEKVQAPTSEKSFTGDEIINLTLLTNLFCRRN